jgi:alpha-glucoside transport system substrate-binding protein
MISGKSAFAWWSALVLCFGVTGCAGTSAPRTVHVLGTWVGDEQDLFKSVLKPFEKRTGIDVRYEGTRDFSAVLAGRVQSGDTPDLALLASPGQFEQYARDGKLERLDGRVDLQRIQREYSPAWLRAGLATGEDGRMWQYGVVVRGKRKNVVWYSRKHWRWPAPHTWADLVNVSRTIAGSGGSPWCVGLRDGSSSGWPGTDWIEDILLRQSGAETYRRWFRGKLAWTSEPVRSAWLAWKQIIELDPAPDGARSMLLTGFNDAEETMFADRPGCYLRRIGYLSTSVYKKHRGDLGYFDLSPTDNSQRGIEIAGDLLTMFHRTPAAEELVKYLTGSEAQSIWVKPGGAVSPNATAEVTSSYPDEPTRRLAQSVDRADCKDVVFDASDVMPVTMRIAFHQAVIEFVAMPQRLDAILKNLDAVRRSAYPAANTSPSAGDGSITC